MKSLKVLFVTMLVAGSLFVGNIETAKASPETCRRITNNITCEKPKASIGELAVKTAKRIGNLADKVYESSLSLPAKKEMLDRLSQALEVLQYKHRNGTLTRKELTDALKEIRSAETKLHNFEQRVNQQVQRQRNQSRQSYPTHQRPLNSPGNVIVLPNM